MNNIVQIDPRLHYKEAKDILTLPIIVRTNKFDEESVQKFYDSMTSAMNTGQGVIPVVVDSYGGQVYALMEMISIVQACPIPVATVCLGKAMSCGSLLFCMAKEGMRYMGPHATLMFHDVSSGNHGKVEEIKTSAKQTEYLNNYIFKLAASHLGKEEDFFLKKLHDMGHAEWYMPAKEAKENGICNHIKIPQFVTKVEFTQSFE